MNILINIVGYIFLVAFILSVIIFLPLGIIWATNHLIGFDIAYTWKSWLAVVLISSLFTASR